MKRLGKVIKNKTTEPETVGDLMTIKEPEIAEEPVTGEGPEADLAEAIRLELEGYSVEELRLALQRHIEQKGLTQATIARAIGISEGSLSLWVSGKYKGSMSNINNAVKGYLQREREKGSYRNIDLSFVATATAKKIFEIARLCHLDGEFGVVYGRAGLGKTWAAREYTRRNPGTILVEADPGWTERVIVRKIHWAIGLNTGGHIDQRMDEIIKELTGTGNLIIVDEAENLPSSVINLVRRIHDHAKIGLLLVGLPGLIHNIRGRRGEFAQLYSRAGAAYSATALNQNDTRAIIRTWLPELNDNIWEVFHEESSGNARVLSKLVLRSARIASVNNSGITAEVVKKARALITV